MIIISGEWIRSKLNLAGPNPVRFLARETEGVYSLLMDVDRHCPNVPGTILVSKKNVKHIKVTDIGEESDRVRVFIRKKALQSNHKDNVRGYVLGKDGWVMDEVMIMPVKEQLYSRADGLIETDKMANKKVLIAGHGSGGSPISVGLVQSGLGNISMIDHDRMCVGNCARHVLGLDDVGRFKTLAMADYLLNKNPELNIETSEEKICLDNVEFVRGLVKEADLVICATGEQVSKRILNRLCLQEGKDLIIAGAYRRAYGGSVLHVTPGKSLCYQCQRQWFPEETQDEEISNSEQAEGLAYTDRPVPIEPGLASDIQPIANLVTKVSIQTLLKRTETTLWSLDDDLAMPLFLWYNRREKDSPAEKFKPLGAHINGMHVLRWYGVRIPRHPGCVECGDFTAELSKEYDITEIEKDEKLFEGDHDKE